MTEIPIFPPAPDGPPLEPGDWFGLLDGIRQVLHRVNRRLPDPQTVHRDEAQKVWSIDIDPVPMAPTTVAGVFFLDVPQLFSTSLGEHWDVHTISATGFTAGTVSGWINVPLISANGQLTAGALRAAFPSAGLANFGKMQCHLRNQDRLVFTAAGIPGGQVPIISLAATRVADEYWGRYLL